MYKYEGPADAEQSRPAGRYVALISDSLGTLFSAGGPLDTKDWNEFIALHGRPGGRDVEEKVAAVMAFLEHLAADPERVHRLAGWHWIRQICDSPPPTSTPFAA